MKYASAKLLLIFFFQNDDCSWVDKVYIVFSCSVSIVLNCLGFLEQGEHQVYRSGILMIIVLKDSVKNPLECGNMENVPCSKIY